jgi:two-component system nitrate/nitrite response regulator NarL
MSTALISPSQRELQSQAQNSRNGDDAHRRDEIDLLIVDDNHAARYSVWALLSWKPDIRVTGTANSSAEALRLADQCQPHACLISATLGQGEALTLAYRLKHLIDPPRVLIFADAVDQHLACAARVAGADGVLCRYADPEEQVAVVRRAASGKQQFPDLQPSEIHALLDQVEDRDRAIVAMLLEQTPPDHIAGLLGLSARSLELRRQGILKRLGPTCGLDDRRQDGSGHRDPVAGSRETRRSDETGAPERKILPTSDHQMPRLKDGLAEGAQPPDLPDGEHPESSPPAESRQQPQTSPASGLRSRAGLRSLAVLAKRLTMSQPSRHTRYELTWSEIAILGLLGIGLLCVVALCVAIALQ